ncbi:hypothetical protein FKG96_12330 [Olivibacter sp. LS-1]|uniref:hypothetical protein n=1 Tax=Olivibacter sp. LS-1 TaxID=2592345 RepID=UPI0011EB50F9|nr:hypothetical protein [Olivibacter sp. LS-1]QEL01559.1 hypothetical protein FKG96_12330 [Olivibacter sp. LS-1]
MLTVNSISGGGTSGYIYANYPADIDVFALCCIEDRNAGRDLDKKLVQMANDRLQKYCSHWPEFVATSEDPIILKTIFDLEQMVGREIIWVRGMGWETMLRIKRAIPNMDKRFCTTIMKMQAIFELLYMHFELPVKMRLGYRWDEMERANRLRETFKMSTHCEIYDDPEELKNPVMRKALTKHPKGFYYMHRWKDVLWRIGEFPLIEDKIIHYHIKEYWKDKGIPFPVDSNCQNCFWKDPQQLRKNFEANPPIMYWAAIQEEVMGNTFKEDNSLLEIRNMGIQLDFFFGTGSGCKAGFCTD